MNKKDHKIVEEQLHSQIFAPSVQQGLRDLDDHVQRKVVLGLPGYITLAPRYASICCFKIIRVFSPLEFR